MVDRSSPSARSGPARLRGLRGVFEGLWSPVNRLPAVARQRIGLAIVVVAAIFFPLVVRNNGDIDAAANACAFAILALGLNIVVGFAGLLDLGYAAFFAIGAYTYGALA